MLHGSSGLSLDIQRMHSSLLLLASVQAHIAEHILRLRPTCVVVETAITPQHGASTGNEFSCQGEDVIYAGPFVRMLCYCANQLGELTSPTDSPLWEVSIPPLEASELVVFSAKVDCSCGDCTFCWVSRSHTVAFLCCQSLVSMMFPCYTH